MELPCIYRNNTTIQNDSLKILSIGSVGYFITFVIGVIGTLNNVLLLIVFYRLKYFGQKEKILFWNLAIVDLLCCLTTTIAMSYLIWFYLKRIPNVEKQVLCTGLFFFPNSLTTVTNRMAVAIAIDRLLTKRYLLKWSSYGKTFRKISVPICWAWGTLQSIALIATTSNVCVKACSPYSCSFRNNWLETFITTVDMSMSTLIICLYIIIPVITSNMLKSCTLTSTDHSNVFYPDRILQQQTRYVQQIRLVSGFYIILCLSTQFPGLLFCDLIAPMFSTNLEATTIATSITTVLLTLYSCLSSFIWLTDVKFRKCLISLLTKGRVGSAN